MLPRFGASLLFLTLAFAVLHAEEKIDNPFKMSKVGDYVTYKVSIKGQPVSTTVKQTVTEKTDKEVTIEIQTSSGGKEFPSSKNKIDLTKPFDSTSLAKNTEVKTLDSGKETLTINGKEYACVWIKTKSITKVADKEFTAEAKTWTCKDIPLNGVVKVETISDFVNSTMELVEFGTKK